MTVLKNVLRPDLDQLGDDYPALYITGTLPIAAPALAYEGRLQIHNQIGPCSVIEVTGSVVPPGGQWYVDDDELVLSWPAYSETESEIPNGDFSLGDLTNWNITKTGERLPTYPATASVSSARPPSGSTYSGLWVGNEGYGHARGVEALWENDKEGITYPTVPVTISAKIALDDTDTSQNRGQVRARFYDVSDNLLLERSGTLIRGDNESYQTSSVTAVAPLLTSYVKAAVWTTANESPNSGVRFGQVEWDIPAITGVNIETTLCFTVTIRDSAGRTAQWSGCVTVTVWDGTWTTKASPVNLHNVGYSPTLGSGLGRLVTSHWMASGVNLFYYSDDGGNSWTQGTGPNMGIEVFTWSPEALMFVGAGIASSNMVWSTDGINWTAGTNIAGYTARALYMTNVGLWVGMGGSGSAQFRRSADGKAWLWPALSFPGGSLGNAHSGAYSPELGIAVFGTDSGRFFYTTNGTNWLEGVVTGTSGGNTDWYTLEWQPEFGRFVAISANANTVAHSPDGVNWTMYPITGLGRSHRQGTWSGPLGFWVLPDNGSGWAMTDDPSALTGWTYSSGGTGGFLIGGTLTATWAPSPLSKFVLGNAGGISYSNN